MFIIIFISHTVSWCQISGKIQKNFRVIKLTYTAFQEDLKYSDFFRDQASQRIGDVRREFIFYGLEIGLEKAAVLIQVTLGPAQQELNKVQK